MTTAITRLHESSKVRTIGGLAIGTCFGWLLTVSGVANPRIIIAQLLLEDFTMMSMFLAATASGMMILTILASPIFGGGRVAEAKAPTALGFGVMAGYGANVVGGGLLGLGMALAGSCPGTVAAQLGAGNSQAIWIMTGGFLGTLTFGLAYPSLVALSHGKFLKKGTIQLLVTGAHLQVGISIALAAASYFFQTKLSYKLAAVMSPFIAGSLIGVLQLPSIICTASPMGISSSYCAAASICRQAAGCDPGHDYFCKFSGLVAWYSLPNFAGIIFGGWIAAPVAPSIRGVDPYSSTGALVGILSGFIMLVGARLAGGCTSGHGISGIAQLSTASVITVAMMFGGGISSAKLLYG